MYMYKTNSMYLFSANMFVWQNEQKKNAKVKGNKEYTGY